MVSFCYIDLSCVLMWYDVLCWLACIKHENRRAEEESYSIVQSINKYMV